MSEPAVRLPSFEDGYREIQALPETLTGEILEPGVVRTMSRPGRAHRFVTRRILQDLGAADQNVGGSGWWIELEVELRLLLDRLAVPDVSGWRVERAPDLPNDNPITLVPDWVCEVLSPTTAVDDRRLKLPLYAKAGIAWTWIVDPAARLVEVFEALEGRATFVLAARENEALVLPPFDLRFDLSGWFLPKVE